METPLLVAKVLAGYFIISGIFMITRQRTLTTVLKDFFNHPAIVYLTGTILVFLGLILSLQREVVAWRSWVTVVGALALIKGLLYLFFPQTLQNLHIERSKPLVMFGGLLAIAIGVYLLKVS